MSRVVVVGGSVSRLGRLGPALLALAAMSAALPERSIVKPKSSGQEGLKRLTKAEKKREKREARNRRTAAAGGGQ